MYLRAGKTADFIKAFLEGTLGRKKVHGSYRVIVGPHCRLLVHAETSRGTPTGSNLLAIDLTPDSSRLRFVFETSIHFAYRSTKDAVGIRDYPSLPIKVLHKADRELINSGVVDVGTDKALIEIGNDPYLIHFAVKGSLVQPTLMEPLENRCGSIDKAESVNTVPEGCITLLDSYIVKPMGYEFTPPSPPQNLIDVLSQPLSPLNYGYKIEECMKRNSKYLLCPKDCPNPDDDNAWRTPKIVLPTQRQTDWRNAMKAYDKALEDYNRFYPTKISGLHTGITGNAEDSRDIHQGTIVNDSSGQFLIGTLHDDGYKVKATLNQWHKIIRKMEAYRIEYPT